MTKPTHPLVLTLALAAGCTDGVVDDPLAEDGDDPHTRTITIHTPETTRVATARFIDDVWTIDGDVRVRPADLSPDRSAPSLHDRWPNGIVPYEVDPALPEPNKRRITEAREKYQRFTSVRMVPYEGLPGGYVHFQAHPTKCRAGDNGYGPGLTTIELHPNCSTPTTQHEVGHVLGLYHEHQRPDRDTFVAIHLENTDNPDAFEKLSFLDVDWPIAGPYDLTSIMHYHSGSQQAPGDPDPTITLADGVTTIAQNLRFSDGDLRTLDKMYPTKNTELPHVCRTAPVRGTPVRRADMAEIWEDIDSKVSIGLHHSTGLAFSPPNDLWTKQMGGFGPRVRWMAGNFDNDGDQDLMAAWNDAGLVTLTIRRSSGSGFSHEHWAIQKGGWMDSTQFLPGDFNGDGRADVAAVWNDAGPSTSIAVYLANSAGTGFLPHVQWVVKSPGWTPATKWTVGNFNGDLRDDLVAISEHAGSNNLTVWISTGTAFSSQAWGFHLGGWMDSTQWLAGDFTGDGLSDLAAVWNDAGPTTSIAVYPSSGARFTGFTQWSTRDGGWAENTKWTAGDVNADGKADVIASWNDAGQSTVTVRRSLGSSFALAQHWGVRRAGWQNSASWCAGTFDTN